VRGDAARWPRLKLEPHPLLDWCPIFYGKARLLEIADALGAISTPAIPVKGRRDAVWNMAIENVLHALAANKAALKALNRRKPTLPARVLGLNRAVHFHVQAELHPEHKRTAIYADVGDAWGVSAGQVKDDVREYAVRDGREYRPDDAKRLMLTIVHNTCNASGRPLVDVLRDFDADLRDRGATEK
jgi:hypothetical protein